MCRQAKLPTTKVTEHENKTLVYFLSAIFASNDGALSGRFFAAPDISDFFWEYNSSDSQTTYSCTVKFVAQKAKTIPAQSRADLCQKTNRTSVAMARRIKTDDSAVHQVVPMIAIHGICSEICVDCNSCAKMDYSVCIKGLYTVS